MSTRSRPFAKENTIVVERRKHEPFFEENRFRCDGIHRIVRGKTGEQYGRSVSHRLDQSQEPNSTTCFYFSVKKLPVRSQEEKNSSSVARQISACVSPLERCKRSSSKRISIVSRSLIYARSSIRINVTRWNFVDAPLQICTDHGMPPPPHSSVFSLVTSTR